MEKLRIHHIGVLIALFALTLVACNSQPAGNTETAAETVATESSTQVDTVWKYGLPLDAYNVTFDTIQQGETLTDVLCDYGMTTGQVYELAQCPDTIFDVRKMRAGQAYAFMTSKDTLATPMYFVYEISPKEYVVFDLQDGYEVTRGTNPSEWREAEVAGVINSSLWVAMEESGASPILAVTLSHIFGWSIDFFGIQPGDEFRLIYAQEYVEEMPLGNYEILAASFVASDSTYYAIPFVQEEEELYYNADGNSLEGAFLKAPLDYYRISSQFSNSRYHPVLKRYRAHHGVDYAAPTGTPVYAIGSGKVIAKAYQANGGGNYVKIRHNSTYTTTYMHLSRFADGLNVGDHVEQKEVIGYVGSTGLSTGPHLDFRVHENGVPINPLTIKSQPKKPISEENMEAFTVVRDSLITRLTAIPMATPTAENSLPGDTLQ